jgi:hypothetical protein
MLERSTMEFCFFSSSHKSGAYAVVFLFCNVDAGNAVFGRLFKWTVGVLGG